VHAVYEACGFALEEKIRVLTVQLQAAVSPEQPRGLGANRQRMFVR
jgi:hypothetical protein